MTDVGIREAAMAALPKALHAFGFPSSTQAELLKYRENAVFRVLHDDARSVLRLHRPGYRSLAELVSEVLWVRSLAEAGVRAPRHIADPSGLIFHCVESRGYTFACSRLEWETGLPPGPDQQLSAYRQAGRVAAQIHAHSANWTPPPGFTRPFLDEKHLFGENGVWGDYSRLECLRSSQVQLLNRAATVVRERLATLPKTSCKWGLVHGDLMPENLLVSGDTVTVIDFDDGGWSWYLLDLAVAVAPYLGTGAYDGVLQAWLDGYREVSDPTLLGLEQLDAMIMARMLMGLGWLHDRQGSETAQEMTAVVLANACKLARNFI